MKKFILIILVAAAAAYFVISFVVTKQNTSSTGPSVEKAPYMVQTVSRVYYARIVSGNSSNLTMDGYYYRNHNRWEYVNHNITLDKSFNAKVTRR